MNGSDRHSSRPTAWTIRSPTYGILRWQVFMPHCIGAAERPSVAAGLQPAAAAAGHLRVDRVERAVDVPVRHRLGPYCTGALTPAGASATCPSRIVEQALRVPERCHCT